MSEPRDEVLDLWDRWYTLPESERVKRERRAGGEIKAALDYDEEVREETV